MTDSVHPLPRTPEAIELRHLRAFVAVAEELNFGRAAVRLYVSQPALSRQIRALERQVGCDLLRRSTHHVELTLAGEALLARTVTLLQDLDEAITAARSVGGELRGRINRLWAPMAAITGDGVDTEVEQLRIAFEEFLAKFPPPADTETRPVNADGVPGLLLAPADADDTTVLFLHGGGYCTGSAYGYRGLAGALATEARAHVMVSEYRLAPEHPYPAAIDDALHTYRWLLARGTDPNALTLAGDSTGAALALALLLRLREHHDLPLPARTLLLCPSLTLDTTPAPAEPGDTEPPTPEQGLIQRMATRYLNGHPPGDPAISPLTTDLTGLPPLLIQAATGDPLAQEAHQLAEHAKAHGVTASVELYPTDAHNFHTFWSFLPEAAEALHHAGQFHRRAHHTEPGGRQHTA